MLIYAPSDEQPPLGRRIDSLPEDERIVFERFTNAQFIETLIKFLSLEENKGQDRFHAKFFVLFKVCTCSIMSKQPMHQLHRSIFVFPKLIFFFHLAKNLLCHSLGGRCIKAAPTITVLNVDM